VREDKNLKLATALELGYQSVNINVGKGEAAKGPLGQSAKVRKALELAIDRKALTQVVFNGEFVPGNQWVNPQHPYYQAKFPIPKRDVAKAKALLSEAGISGRLAIDFMVTNTPETRSVAEVLQSMTADAGIDLKIRVTESATAIKQGEDGNFQLYMNWWSGRSDPDGNSFVHQTCGAPQNLGHYCDKEVDAWHLQARAASDPAERKAIYEKIAARFLAEGSLTYLYHPQMLIAHVDRLEGFTPVPDGLVRVIGLKLK